MKHFDAEQSEEARLWCELSKQIEAIKSRHGAPNIIRLNTYATDAELRFFRPDDRLSAAQHRAIMERLCCRIRACGLSAETKMIDTDAYLRWLDDHHLSDSPAVRAAFISGQG